MKFYLYPTLIGLLISGFTHGQSWFSPFTVTLDSLAYGDMEWGDFDNDGDQDLIAIGQREDGTVITTLLENTTSGFSNATTPFFNASQGTVDFVDFDNDNDLDVFISGSNDSYNPQSTLYINNGGTYSTFTSGIQDFTQSGSAWGDYDLDGDLDLFICGSNPSYSSESILYENQGDTFVAVSTTITDISDGSADWADVNMDGYPDLMIAGMDDNGNEITTLFLNNSGTSFTASTSTFTQLSASRVTFFDFDADGDQDVTTMGSDINGDNQLFIYENNAGVFTLNQTLDNIASTTNHSPFSWGDIDGDGWADLIVSGADNNYDYVTVVYKNTNGMLSMMNNTGIPMVGGNSTVTFIDFDGDHDLDFTLSGIDNSSVETEPFTIYINDSATANTLPTVPTSLQHTVTGFDVELDWNQATDYETPDNGLTYNLQLVNESTNQWYITGESTSNGARKITKRGNSNSNIFKHINGLAYGKYKWSVQAIDNSFEPSSFTHDSFIISDLTDFHLLAPANQSAIDLELTTQSVEFNWEKVDSANYYRFQLIKNNQFSSPLVSTLSQNNGADTLYSMTHNDLYALCHSNGQATQTNETYKWIAIAVGKYDSIMSIDTFELDFYLTQTLEEFELVTPTSATTIEVTSTKTDNLTFHWQAASTATKYVWRITNDTDASFNSPIHVSESNNNGQDLDFTIQEDQLSTILSTNGHAFNTIESYLWQVEAYNAYDSLLAKNNFALDITLLEFPTSTADFDNNSVHIIAYQGVLRIENLSTRVIENIQIIDITGKKVLELNSVQEGQILNKNISNLVQGIYFVTYLESGNLKSKKFIIR